VVALILFTHIEKIMGDYKKKKKFTAVCIDDIIVNRDTRIFVHDSTIKKNKKEKTPSWVELDSADKKTIVLSGIAPTKASRTKCKNVCDVCLQSTDKPIQLLHVDSNKCQEIRQYCSTCITLWVYQQKNKPTCPNCRQPIIVRSPFSIVDG